MKKIILLLGLVLAGALTGQMAQAHEPAVAEQEAFTGYTEEFEDSAVVRASADKKFLIIDNPRQYQAFVQNAPDETPTSVPAMIMAVLILFGGLAAILWGFWWLINNF